MRISVSKILKKNLLNQQNQREKMKKPFILFILFFVQFYFGQKIVLYEGKEQTIFIDNINNSEFKNKRADFSFNEFDKQAYQYSLESIKKNNIFLNKFDAKDLPKRWIELFQYKGKFYTYYYCDFCGDYRLEFRKNMLLETTCEGPNIISINLLKKENSKTFTFERINELNDKRKVIIHIIDKEKGIAVFESEINGEVSYKLMLDVTKINQYPMIVNDCKSKQSEFRDFEEPDFKKLLNQN